MLDEDICYRALASRDRRFDGRFVVAVKTTRIYCRPGCPAPLPKRANMAFYACAAAAEQAGFRPCRRCRPDASPETPVWFGTAATVSRAIRLIAGGALDGKRDVAGLAARLGLGERHLRRLFAEHAGTSPAAFALTHRIHFARRLLDETHLKVAEIAQGAGFASLRRFNDAFKKTFRATPRELRGTPESVGSGGLALTLPYKPPFDWESLVAFLSPRAIPGVERVEHGRYRRTVDLGTGPGWIEVRPIDGKDALALEAKVRLPLDLVSLFERTRRLFDLGADPARIADALGDDPLLKGIVRSRLGLRVPGAWCAFEFAVRAILGQQISVAAATTLAGRIADKYGTPVEAPGLSRLFPPPGRLRSADLESVGVLRSRADAIRALAAEVVEGRLRFDELRDLDHAVARLTTLAGIGPWTAHVVAMRALGEPDAFPASDLGLKTALQCRSVSEIEGRAQAWRPFRAYAAMALWRSLDGPGGSAFAPRRSVASRWRAAERRLQEGTR